VIQGEEAGTTPLGKGYSVAKERTTLSQILAAKHRHLIVVHEIIHRISIMR